MTAKALKPVSLQKILNLENMVTFLEFHKETLEYGYIQDLH